MILLLLLCAVAVSAQTPDPGEIMRRVAENSARAQTARGSWVYDQEIFVRLKRSNGKLAREEIRQYTVAPTEKGAERRLDNVEGSVLEGNRRISYTEPGFRTKEMDIDGAIVGNIAKELMWRRDSLGLMEYWPPTEPANLARYVFQYAGEEHYRDYDVYRIDFHSKDKEDPWEGEALIERNEYQPVLVTSAWTGKIPAAVTLLLGTSVKHIGCKTVYKRFDKDLWFPIQTGGEMKVRALFLYSRTIAFSGNNRDFRKTDVQSSVEFGGEAAPQ